MSARTNRPPRRSCPRCGGDHYAWSAQALCPRCRAETAGERAGVAETVRAARLERRRGESAPPSRQTFPYGTIPY